MRRMQGEVVSNHDELMCNFFAQADALATGKTPVELRAENVPDSLIPHKTFTGNRPSTSLLLPELTAFTTGQILSLYENRIAVQARAAPCSGEPKTQSPMWQIMTLALLEVEALGMQLALTRSGLFCLPGTP